MQFPNSFDENKRYIFTNWTTEEFRGSWGGQGQVVAAGETIEVPEYLAYHYTKHLVDREMQRDGKDSVMGVDEMRLPYEEKTMTAIGAGTDSPAMTALKEKIRAEVAEDAMKSADVNVAAPSETEFEGLKDK